ncbi:MAG TPA: trypsin-like peptidase domain-containing protein [Vicinamibacterales bacterium]|nr:trypsin-like peptidase domain-containing protein [Vicinamibacterales bacterium]
MRRLSLALVFVLAGFVAGLVMTGHLKSAGESAAAPAARAPVGVPVRPAPAQTPAPAAPLPDLSGVAARTVGSVTNISSLQVVRTPNSPFASDPLFRYFFGDQDQMFGSHTSQSLGSGVIVSSDGYILTNNHVVGDARADVSVVMPDKRKLHATIVGVDQWTDLAVLKIDAKNLPVLPWGDSSKLKVAEWVLAIGNPFQLNQTVTLGIVSALGRSLEGRLATYEDFIQTDAAINPGNSGGALINARGELVGINTAIFTESGGYQGIGFAIPSNLARHVMNDLIEYGQVQRGTIRGIEIAALTSDIADQLGAPDTRGALVVTVDPGSDAAGAGLRRGDVIVGFNDSSIDDPSQFLRLLSDAKIGSTARLHVLRRGRAVNVSVPVVRSTARRRQ